jgi:sugar phosphate isomerase/epimerase
MTATTIDAARIAYCTNVHAGPDVESTERNLLEHAVRVRELSGTRGLLPVGLWLSAIAAGQLERRDDVRALRDRLLEAGIAVVTLNGFPFIDFHDHAIKHAVYEPHWARPERLAYTLRLANILVDLLPDDVRDASISTVPIGWRPTFTNEGCGASVGIAAAQLEAVVAHLRRIERETGVRLHVDLEPEPGCLLDRAEHVVALFDEALGRTPDARRHLGVCHDICHSAVMFEEQAAALELYRRNGIRVGKVQVSSAIEADGSRSALAALARFDEPKYLHQTVVRLDSGELRFHEDLRPALGMPPKGVFRTHFHVPIHLEAIALDEGVLRTTRGEIDACLAALEPDETRVLEIETYAWPVLPESIRPATLAEGIAAEVRWLRERTR